ncbi:cytoskeletal protein binding protein [Serendipita sp. 399]|nr:cytoskeletal protein binding protein [Serendipita sp. 399]
MAAFKGECLGIYKATYAWEAQGDDEVSMAEDQLVLLLDNSDSDWSKVRIKQASQDLEGPEGLVPAAYIEKATPLSTVKAAYDYEASATGELTITDGEILKVHERDEEWILVEGSGSKQGSFKVGYVPANYVEETDGAEEDGPDSSAAAPTVASIVIPDSPPRPAYVAPEERSAAAAASSDKSKQDPIEIWPVSQLDKKGKKKKGTLGVGNGAVFFTSESDKSFIDQSPVQKWQSSDITDCTLDSKAKQIQIDFANADTLRFVSKDAADAIHRKIESSRALADPSASTPRTTMEESRFSTDSRAMTNPQTPRAMDVVSPPPSEPALSLGRPVDPPKSVHFAAHASEIPPRPESPEDEDEEEAQAAEGENAVALYDFVGDASDELTVKEGEAVWVLDRSNDDWWKCRNQRGLKGVVPAQYLELEVSDGEQDSSQGHQTQVRSAVSGGPGSAAGAAAAAAAAAAASRAKQPSPEPEPEPEEDKTDSEDERERERERLAKEKKEKERKEKERRRAEKEREAREREEEEARAAEEQRRAAEKKKADEKRARAAAAAQQAKQDQKKGESNKLHRKSRSGQDDSDEEDDPRLAGEVHKIIVGRQINKDNASQNNARPSSSAPRHGPPPTGKTRVWHDRTGQFRVEAEFKGYDNGKIRLHKLNGVTIEVPASKMSMEDMRYIEKITKGSTNDDEDEPVRILPKAAPAVAPPKQLSTPPQSSTRAARSDPPPRKPTIDWFEFFLNAGCDMDDCTRYAQSFERDKIDETILPDMKSDTLRALGLREGDIIRVTKAIEKRSWTGLSKNERPGVNEQIQADERYAQQVQEAIFAGKNPPPPPGPLPTKAPTAPAPNLFAGPRGTLKDNTRRGRPAATASRQTSINVDENALASASTQLGNSPTVSTPNVSNRTPSPNLLDVNVTNTANTSTTKPGFDDDAWAIRPSSTKPLSPVIAVSPPASAPPAPAPPAPAPPASATATLAPSTTEAPQRPATTSPEIEKLTMELQLLKQIAELKRPPSAPAPSLQAPAPPPVPSPSAISPSPFNTLAAAPLPPQQTGIYGNTFSPANGVRGPFAPVPANEAVLLKPLPMSFNPQPITTQPFGALSFSAPPSASPPPTDHSPANVFASMKSGAFGGQEHAAPSAPNYDALRANPGVSPLMSQPTGWVPGMPTGYQYR